MSREYFSDDTDICPNAYEEMLVSCNTDIPCPPTPVNCQGKWSGWTEGECSASCGGGVATLSKTYSVIEEASFGGKGCKKPDGFVKTKEVSCHEEECSGCEVDCLGEWSEWGEFGECSKTCG